MIGVGARLPLLLNLAVAEPRFDLFLKVAPGLGGKYLEQR